MPNFISEDQIERALVQKLEQLHGFVDAHGVRQFCHAVDVLGHYFERDKGYAVPVRALPDAGCGHVPVLELLHHLVPVLRAPFYVPCAFSYAVASPEQILHSITFLRLERDSYH